jgi:hypothetical protein
MLRADRRTISCAGLLGAAAVCASFVVAVAMLMSLAAAARADTSPCTIYWTDQAGDGLWDHAGNWSLTDGGPSAGRVPGASDFVCVSTAPSTSASYSIAFSNFTIAGIDWTVTSPQLQFEGGFTLTIGNGSDDDASTIDEPSVIRLATEGSPW